MNKTALIIILVGLAAGLFFMFRGQPSNQVANSTEVSSNNESPISVKKGVTSNLNNVEVIDGVQYITIEAKGGYSPRVTSAKAGIPTKLLVKTNGTYDCSVALSIRSANFQKILAKTGEEEIDLGTPSAGTPTLGVCGMGMYSFEINYQ